MPFYYITRAMLAKDHYGRRIFSDLQEDIIVFHLFNQDGIKKIIQQSGFSLKEYEKLRKKTFRKLEKVICELVRFDLKQNVFSPDAAQKELERFWQDKNFPLKENLRDIFIGQEITEGEKEFRGVRKIQDVAEQYQKPWVYLKRPKLSRKKTRPEGIYKNADEKTKKLIAEIDKENYEKSKIVSIICSEKMAKYLLARLSEVLNEKNLGEEIL